jgi:adenine-specific DNA-methyltransferase
MLNSKIADFYIKQLGITRNGGYFEYKPMFIEQLPIPMVSQEIEEKFSSIVRQILTSDKSDVSNLDSKIDQLAFDLFDLSTDEIEAVLAS